MITYILPFLAIVVGFGIVYFFKENASKHFKLVLAFSGAFLLATTVFELLPEIYTTAQPKTVGLCIMFGVLLQIFLEFFSKGAEHGHVHIHSKNNAFPWLLFISLSIHAIIEGIPIHHNDNLLYGIVIHKIPIAIVLSTFFLSSNLSNKKTFIFLLLFALMTPLGSFLVETFEGMQNYLTEISAVVIGIFLHISTTILFESSEGHKFNLAKLLTIVIAVALAYFI